MPYSFFPYEPKSPISETVRRIWWIGIMILVLLMGSGMYAYWKKERLAVSIQMQKKQQQTLQRQLRQLQEQLRQGLQLRALGEQMDIDNNLLGDQMANLLGLIPDDTVLGEFELMDDALIYSGVSADLPTLQSRFSQALSGEYRLTLSEVNDENNSEDFYFYFMQSGDGNGT